jgi:hypothetical protein
MEIAKDLLALGGVRDMGTATEQDQTHTSGGAGMAFAQTAVG